MAQNMPPPWTAPSSSVTVKVSAIDTTLLLNGISSAFMYEEKIRGFDRMVCGTWSLIIEHPSGRKLLYDLGCRKNPMETLAPANGIKGYVGSGTMLEISVEKNVSEILTGGGIGLDDIEAVIWSHYHFDHTGDMSTFPSTTKLVVGPGFKENFMPGYPSDPNGHTLESDFAGREVVELDFNQAASTIGRFKAIDYFGDGSFYILDAMGHTIDHINALARTHASPSPAFIHMSGDTFHHVAEIRPSSYVPLPGSITPSPLPRMHGSVCPGELFSPVLKNGSRSDHILTFHDILAGKNEEGKKKVSMIHDEPALRDTLSKTEEFDAAAEVFTLGAHDWTLKGVIPEWPVSLNAWKEEAWKSKVHWSFLADFEKACT